MRYGFKCVKVWHAFTEPEFEYGRYDVNSCDFYDSETQKLVYTWQFNEPITEEEFFEYTRKYHKRVCKNSNDWNFIYSGEGVKTREIPGGGMMTNTYQLIEDHYTILDRWE